MSAVEPVEEYEPHAGEWVEKQRSALDLPGNEAEDGHEVEPVT